MWRPFSEDEAAPGSAATGSTHPDDASADSPQPVSQQSVSTASDTDGETPATTATADPQGELADEVAGNTTPERLAVPQAPPAVLQAPIRTSAAEAAAPPAVTSSPVWVIENDDQNSTERKRPGGETVMTSLQDADRPMSPSEAMERRMAEAAKLKPITEILPYHDYIPSGTTEPGDVLCLDGEDGMNCPRLAELPETGFEERLFAETYVAWEPTNLFSNPLYFEDASLERYGHTHGCLQPLVSLGKFSAQLVGLPYQMALHPIHERRYALGWYRPGEYAPYKYYLPPWNTKAALTAGAAYTGLIFLIP